MSDFHGKSTIDDCKVIALPKIHHPNGNLTLVQNHQEVQFDIARVYYVYDVPAGADRGGHSHKECLELLVAATGSFDVGVNDGKATRRFSLNRPDQALLIVPGIWRTLHNFSSAAVCLVIDSHRYDENDYVRDYLQFTTMVNSK